MAGPSKREQGRQRQRGSGDGGERRSTGTEEAGTGTNGNRVYATLTVLQTPVYAVQTRRSRLGTRRAARRRSGAVNGASVSRQDVVQRLCSRGGNGGVAGAVARREKNQCSAVQCGAGRQQTWTADMDSRQQTRLLSSLSSLLVGGARQGYRHEPRAWPPANWGSRAESGTAPDSPPLPATDCPP
jgi:hypothetical protein